MYVCIFVYLYVDIDTNTGVYIYIYIYILDIIYIYIYIYIYIRYYIYIYYIYICVCSNLGMYLHIISYVSMHTRTSWAQPPPFPKRTLSASTRAPKANCGSAARRSSWDPWVQLENPWKRWEPRWKWWKNMENSSHTFPTNVQFTPLGRVVSPGRILLVASLATNETKHLVDRSTVVQKQQIDLAKPGPKEKKSDPNKKKQKTKPPTTQQPWNFGDLWNCEAPGGVGGVTCYLF